MSNLPHYHPTRRTVLQAGSIGLMGLGMNHLGLIRSLVAQSLHFLGLTSKILVSSRSHALAGLLLTAWMDACTALR